MRTRLLVPALAALAALAGLPAHAACARFTASDIFLTYDPLGAEGAGQITRPVVLSVARGSDAGGPSSPKSDISAQFVEPDDVNITRVGTRGPIYSIYANQAEVLVDRTAAPLRPSEIFTHHFGDPANFAEAVHGLQLIIDGGQDIAAGVYEDKLEIQYSCAAAAAAGMPRIQPSVLRVRVDVPSKIIANLAGGSTSGTLDFADFATPARTASVNVYSTGPYALKVESANDGAMKLTETTGLSGASTQIAYNLSFQGVAVVLGQAQVFPRTGVAGAALPLVVTAEPIASKRAGAYHDTLTLTFTPLSIL
jgi:hypothetical protein